MLGFNELQSSSTTLLHSQSSQVMENEGFLSTPQENHEKQSPTHPEPTLASTLRSCLGVFARNLLEEKNPRAAEQALQEFGMDGSLIPLDPSGAAAVAAASPTKPCSPNRDSLGISLGLQGFVCSPLWGQSFALPHCSEFYFCPINSWQNKAQPPLNRAG